MGKFKGNLAKFKFLANKEWFSPKVPFRRFWEIASKGQCLWCPIPKKNLKHLRVGPHSSRWNSIWNQKEITMKRTTRHQKNTRWKIIYQNEMAFMFCVSKSNQISWCIFHNLFSGDLLGWRLWHFTVGNASSKTTLFWASYPVEDVSNWLTVNMKRIWFFLFKITPSFLSV